MMTVQVQKFGGEAGAASGAVGGPVQNGTAAATPGPCCSEDAEANRVPSHATLAGNVMTVSLDDVPADGVQVAAVFDDATLYASRIHPTCNLPAPLCQDQLDRGFSVRFYVGHRP